MLGREWRLPDQLLHGTHSAQSWTRRDYVTDLQNIILTAHDSLRSQQILPRRSANNEEESLFKKGDLILIENKRRGIHLKVQPKFAGPFLVKTVYDNGTYKIATQGTVNECRLKLFTPCANAAGQPAGAGQEAKEEVRFEHV